MPPLTVFISDTHCGATDAHDLNWRLQRLQLQKAEMDEQIWLQVCIGPEAAHSASARAEQNSLKCASLSQTAEAYPCQKARKRIKWQFQVCSPQSIRTYLWWVHFAIDHRQITQTIGLGRFAGGEGRVITEEEDQEGLVGAWRRRWHLPIWNIRRFARSTNISI